MAGCCFTSANARSKETIKPPLAELTIKPPIITKASLTGSVAIGHQMSKLAGELLETDEETARAGSRSCHLAALTWKKRRT